MNVDTKRRPAVIVAAVVLGAAACGGGTPTEPAPEGGTVTATLTGTARASNATSCGGDSLAIDAGSGEVAVTLVQTTPSTPLIVQLCAPTATNHATDCSINRTTIAVGETRTGTVRGGRSQLLALNPADCASGQPPQFPSIAYTVSVRYPR